MYIAEELNEIGNWYVYLCYIINVKYVQLVGKFATYLYLSGLKSIGWFNKILVKENLTISEIKLYAFCLAHVSKRNSLLFMM